MHGDVPMDTGLPVAIPIGQGLVQRGGLGLERYRLGFHLTPPPLDGGDLISARPELVGSLIERTLAGVGIPVVLLIRSRDTLADILDLACDLIMPRVKVPGAGTGQLRGRILLGDQLADTRKPGLPFLGRPSELGHRLPGRRQTPLILGTTLRSFIQGQTPLCDGVVHIGRLGGQLLRAMTDDIGVPARLMDHRRAQGSGPFGGDSGHRSQALRLLGQLMPVAFALRQLGIRRGAAILQFGDARAQLVGLLSRLRQ